MPLLSAPRGRRKGREKESEREISLRSVTAKDDSVRL